MRPLELDSSGPSPSLTVKVLCGGGGGGGRDDRIGGNWFLVVRSAGRTNWRTGERGNDLYVVRGDIFFS